MVMVYKMGRYEKMRDEMEISLERSVDLVLRRVSEVIPDPVRLCKRLIFHIFIDPTLQPAYPAESIGANTT